MLVAVDPLSAGAVLPLPQLPYLRPWYRTAADGERLLLEHGGTVVVLEGAALKRLVPALLPLLDGTRALEEIVAQLGAPARPAVEHALALLADRGLLTEGPPLDELPEPFAASAESLAATRRDGASPQLAQQRLRDARVAVAGGRRLVATLSRELLRAGVGRVDHVDWEVTGLDGAYDVAVACAGPAELAELGEWDRHRNDDGVPWLALPPFDGRLAPIGPLVVPGETACLACYRLRRAATSDCREELRALEHTPSAARAATALESLVAGVAALALLRYLAGLDPTLPGSFYALDAGVPLSLSRHRVLRVPRCPACSEVDVLAAPLPWFKEISDGA
ncbi:MAG TPA: TOMM precursor leader peptide-binding protein [Gaiellaceae bacterium]|nr:TOMM precursor leader peptide-binding protein [Gaiellaceae bacterium]